MAKTRAMYPSANLTDIAIDGFMEEWAVVLLEVGPTSFDKALSEHIRNAKWFPTVAELRERAGLHKSDTDAVDANAAWEFVVNYIRRHWHPDIGSYDSAPRIPENIDYAIRQVGGLRAINECKLDNRPFMKKDFCEALRLAPIAEERQMLSGGTDYRKELLGALKSLSDGKSMR